MVFLQYKDEGIFGVTQRDGIIRWSTLRNQLNGRFLDAKLKSP